MHCITTHGDLTEPLRQPSRRQAGGFKHAVEFRNTTGVGAFQSHIGCAKHLISVYAQLLRQLHRKTKPAQEPRT